MYIMISAEVYNFPIERPFIFLVPCWNCCWNMVPYIHWLCMLSRSVNTTIICLETTRLWCSCPFKHTDYLLWSTKSVSLIPQCQSMFLYLANPLPLCFLFLVWGVQFATPYNLWLIFFDLQFVYHTCKLSKLDKNKNK